MQFWQGATVNWQATRQNWKALTAIANEKQLLLRFLIGADAIGAPAAICQVPAANN